MSILFGCIILGLILLCIYFYQQNVKLNRKVRYLQPLVETAENIRDILYYCEVVPKLNYLYLSKNVNDLLGPNTYEEHLNNPESIFEIVHPDDREILINKKLGELNFHEAIQVRFRNHLGHYIWFEEYATPIYKEGKFVAVLGIYRNIDEKVVLQQQLEYKSTHDALTKLYNREYFQRKMSELNEIEVPVAVIAIDIDELKIVNDSYGHQMGDRLIIEAANCLKNHAMEEMIVARIGGDEFAILLPHATEMQVKEYIEAIQKNLQVGDKEVPYYPIRISVGYAYSETSYGVMEQLLNEADAKMYNEKNAKKESLVGV
ncbi:sensor domain-containing diguanylate cyclase [Ureibacillus acetophenoni]|uniref:PAS domain S-box-containing protein/diguanylate cyclase (GGDEF)-like protein n=1 Tax=Ureibacillus acetophenoni TaxID=614649 RepID=A0A285UWD8_9BACL|nr:sensor domain-containing diguanylate cyclase [Ureibacillus acetophenoni]SOC44551.1 PAS domain S-box-containing protein/diguanylate cyclase (GGDEF)-like protein [Ureibacillus acetophenoni]